MRALGRHGVAHEAVDDGAGTRVVRERGAHDGVVGGVATDALDAALDAHGALHVRLHEAHRLPEAWLERGLRRLSDSIGSNLSEHTLELWDKGQEKLRPEKREEFWNSLGSRKREFMAQRDEILEKYHALLERPGRVYTHLLKAFPHLRQTEMHLRLERIWELYRQRRNKK